MSRRIVLLLALAALAVPVWAAPMTTLRIEVKSAAGKPVERASVVVRFVEGRSIIKLRQEDQNQLGTAHEPGRCREETRRFRRAKS